MDTALKYFAWAWWCLFYAVTPRPKDLGDFIISHSRRRVPWWKFKPNVYHSDDGKQWRVSFKGEDSYTRTMQLQVEARIDRETEEIVGLTIWDEILKPPYKPWEPPPYNPPPGVIPLEEARETGCCRVCGGRLLEPNAEGNLEPLPMAGKFGDLVYPVAITLKFGKEFAHPSCLA